MDPEAEFVGITDNLHEVRRLADQTPDGMALALDLDLARQQAKMIAGEDEGLAHTIVSTVLSMTEMQTDLMFDPETGHVMGERGTGRNGSEDVFLRGCIVGKTAGYLQLISLWPGDPLDLADANLNEVEKRVSELWTQAANRLGIVPTIL